MGAIPPYPYKHTGTCIVVGGDPDRLGEVEVARRLRPHARIFAVNSASGRIAADFIGSGHVEELREWRAMQAGINPKPFTVHSAKFTKRLDYGAHPYIDHFWTGCVTQATSTLSVALIALSMGFREVILTAAAMSESFAQIHGSAIAHHHRVMLGEEARRFKGSVFGMSGYPLKVLGAAEGFDGSV